MLEFQMRPNSDAAWSQAARELVDLQFAASYEASLQSAVEIGERYGLNRQTMRRARHAYEFSCRFVACGGVDISFCSLDAVETLRKWAAYDMGAARDAAANVLDGFLSVRELRRAEVAARRLVGAGCDRGRLKRAKLLDEIEAYLIRDHPGWTVQKGAVIKGDRVDFYIDGSEVNHRKKYFQAASIVSLAATRSADSRRKRRVSMDRASRISPIVGRVFVFVELCKSLPGREAVRAELREKSMNIQVVFLGKVEGD